MKKYIINTLIATLIIGTLSFSPSSTFAATTKATSTDAKATVSSKEEVIYATLENTGKIRQIYSVNILNVSKSGTVSDYGEYTSVKNLTSTKAITYTDGKVSVSADSGRFYYQGNMEGAVLPWNIKITYYLDDKLISASSLAGKSGKVKIKISTSKNTAVDSSFYDNYMLQISATLNTTKCKNIVAEGGTFANAGSNKLITFTVMPGSDANIEVTANATNFEMDSISFSAIPFSMKINLPDTSGITSGLTSLSDAVTQLNAGVKKLKSGAESLVSGATALKSGSNNFKGGLDVAGTNSSAMAAASASILQALNYINSNLEMQLKSIPQNSELSGALTPMSKGLAELSSNFSKFNEGLKAYTEGIKQLAAAYAAINGGIEGFSMASGQLSGGISDISNGTGQLEAQTKTIPGKINTSLNDILASYSNTSFTPKSFISAKNSNVASVQFVIKTDKIEKPAQKAQATVVAKASTFWTRLIDLFK